MGVVGATPWTPYLRERPATHCIGGWVSRRAGLNGCGKSCPTPPGFDPRTVHSVASRYTDWAIPGICCAYSLSKAQDRMTVRGYHRSRAVWNPWRNTREPYTGWGRGVVEPRSAIHAQKTEEYQTSPRIELHLSISRTQSYFNTVSLALQIIGSQHNPDTPLLIANFFKTGPHERGERRTGKVCRYIWQTLPRYEHV